MRGGVLGRKAGLVAHFGGTAGRGNWLSSCPEGCFVRGISGFVLCAGPRAVLPVVLAAQYKLNLVYAERELAFPAGIFFGCFLTLLR